MSMILTSNFCLYLKCRNWCMMNDDFVSKSTRKIYIINSEIENNKFVSRQFNCSDVKIEEVISFVSSRKVTLCSS